ncbi:MAG: fumarylacetoacetate hydrolase family protein [Chloroflexi bacterium]|nr:fumarylacetoacetate hydrolase family protein [Chloroflexota bacterium]
MAKIARFVYQNTTSYGLLEGDSTLRLIEGDIFGAYCTTEQRVALDAVQLLAPVTPPNIIAIGLNYRAHAIESNLPIPDRPVVFIKAGTSLTGPGAPIELPRMAPNEVDYECELAIVIGKRAKHVTADEALEYALGYTCANDVSARDLQTREDTQWARGKSFDTFAPLGPWIETELDPDNVRVRSRVNGQVMQDSNTNDLIFSCRELISYLSDAMTLLPGTVILTGTPSGVGFARKPPVFLRPGDLVEIDLEGIGVLANPVIAEP